VLQCVAVYLPVPASEFGVCKRVHVAKCCSVLQCVAVYLPVSANEFGVCKRVSIETLHVHVGLPVHTQEHVCVREEESE